MQNVSKANDDQQGEIIRLLMLTNEKLATQVEDLKQVIQNTNYTNNKLDDIINNRIPAITDRLEWINGDIVKLHGTTQNIYNKINDITTQLSTLNTQVLNIYNELDANHKELLTELEKDNEAVVSELKQINSSLATLLEQQNKLQEENNKLQQEQNQLQEEQNNFLKQDTSDSDVSVDNFSDIDSNDITSEGLTGIFNTIYNSVVSWKSKDIVLPIPFTDKSVVVPANYVENMIQKTGATWVSTLVHSVYYFIIGRFIVYSITKIVNSIKDGSILNTGNDSNITTDML